MSLGTKNRQAKTAELCKQHLRDKYIDKVNLVEEYIREIEGTGKDRDITHWGSFTDIRGISDETIKRVDERFEPTDALSRRVPGGFGISKRR